MACSCCTSSSNFFGSNCQNDQFIYAQATGPFGFTDASLKAGETLHLLGGELLLLGTERCLAKVRAALHAAATVAALKCGNGGSLSRC